MTVTTTQNSITYAANGVTTAYAFPYIFFAPSDLIVTLVDIATGAAVAPPPVLNGGATYDYTVTGDLDNGEYASGATVTFNTAPLGGYSVLMVRAVPATQTVTLIDNTKFPAATINTEFDKLTILAQQSAFLSGSGSVPTGPAGGHLSGSYPNPTIAVNVPLAGNPTTTTQPIGTNNTTIATTAFVAAAAGQRISAALTAGPLPAAVWTQLGGWVVSGNDTGVAAGSDTWTAPAGRWVVLGNAQMAAPVGQTVGLSIGLNGTSTGLQGVTTSGGGASGMVAVSITEVIDFNGTTPLSWWGFASGASSILTAQSWWSAYRIR